MKSLNIFSFATRMAAISAYFSLFLAIRSLLFSHSYENLPSIFSFCTFNVPSACLSLLIPSNNDSFSCTLALSESLRSLISWSFCPFTILNSSNLLLTFVPCYFFSCSILASYLSTISSISLSFKSNLVCKLCPSDLRLAYYLTIYLVNSYILAIYSLNTFL